MRLMKAKYWVLANARQYKRSGLAFICDGRIYDQENRIKKLFGYGLSLFILIADLPLEFA